MFKLEIRTENAAFDGDDCRREVARILHEAADMVADCETDRDLRDVNGNRVGFFHLTGE